MHVFVEAQQDPKDIKANLLEEEELIVEFIDPCLISIYQLPDLEVIGPRKKMIRE